MAPKIIQGGMGVNISPPHLARTVAMLGGLGTVSGVAANLLLPRALQDGDPGGHLRRALEHFPFPDIAEDVLREYFVPGGRSPLEPYHKTIPAVTLTPTRMAIALAICANYAFVWLAKEGHDNPISINWLEKMQLVHLYGLYGAMLAGVNFVAMGAGIPDQIPAMINAYGDGHAAEYRVTVTGCAEGTKMMRFDPAEYFGRPVPKLQRPSFLPIVSSDVLAGILMKLMKKKKLPDAIQGFVVEVPTAGGHNAPPRGQYATNDLGEPIYGPRDAPDFIKLQALGVPFWIGGSFASPAGLSTALSLGASGIQVGSIFALCEDSGLAPMYRRETIRRWHRGQLQVKTDAQASPTGFPFKVAQLPGTLSEEEIYRLRHRICNQHGLATPHQLPNGDIVYRCPAEPTRIYRRNGGQIEDTVAARCLCNGLMAAAGVGDPLEPAIVTLGDDLNFLRYLTTNENDSYSAAQAMAYLLAIDET